MGDAGRGQGWGRGNTLSSEERETETFFKRSCICCLFLHKVFHSQTYQLRAGIIPFAPEPAVWERLSPPHAALARVAQLELKGRALRWRRCCHLGAEPGLGVGGGLGLGSSTGLFTAALASSQHGGWAPGEPHLALEVTHQHICHGHSLPSFEGMGETAAAFPEKYSQPQQQ